MDQPSSCPVHKYLQMPVSALVVFAASAGALVFAFTVQYGFGIAPCVLCLWQRVPFGLGLFCAVAALIWRPYGLRSRLLIGVCCVLFLMNTGLAFFHTGVEREWWEGTSGCSITPLEGNSPESWRDQIMSAATGHCDEISWTFLGLSMANWNIPFSALLTIYTGMAALYGLRRPRP